MVQPNFLFFNCICAAEIPGRVWRPCKCSAMAARTRGVDREAGGMKCDFFVTPSTRVGLEGSVWLCPRELPDLYALMHRAGSVG